MADYLAVPVDLGCKVLAEANKHIAVLVEGFSKFAPTVNAEIPFVPAPMCYCVYISLFYAMLKDCKSRLSYTFLRKLVEFVWRLSFPFLAFWFVFIPMNNIFCNMFSGVSDAEQRWQWIYFMSTILTLLTLIGCIYFHHRSFFNKRGIYLHKKTAFLQKCKWFRACSPLPPRRPRMPTKAELKRIIVQLPKGIIHFVIFMIKLIFSPVRSAINGIRGRRAAVAN